MNQRYCGMRQSSDVGPKAESNTCPRTGIVSNFEENLHVSERNWAWASGRQSYDWMDFYSSVSLDDWTQQNDI